MTVKVRPYIKNDTQTGWEVDITLTIPGRPKLRERRKAPVTAKSAAKRWGEERERQLIQHAMNTDPAEDGNDRPDLVKKEVPTLAQFIPRYMEYSKGNRHRLSTLRGKRQVIDSHLDPQLGHKRLNRITAEDIHRLKVSMSALKVTTVNRVLTMLRAILNAAVELEVIPELPVKIVNLREPELKMRFYDFNEYARLVAAARELDPRVLVVTLLGGDAGLRCGEMMALEWSDIDLDRGRLTVAHSKHRGEVTSTKGYRQRTLPLSDQLRAALRKHRTDGTYVLCSRPGSAPCATTIRRWLSLAQKAAGLDIKGPHTLRHTFCSHLAMRGAPARAIQKLAGHQSITTTERYMNLAPSTLDESIRLLNRRPVWRHDGDDDPSPFGA